MRNPILQYWRVLTCLCVIMYHTLCLFYGIWPPIGHPLLDNIPSWAYRFGCSLHPVGILSSFAFISGAALYYSAKRKYSFLRFIWKKTCRILLPCLVFAVLYKILFPSLMYSVWPAPINGTHLWYLPMIFLCLVLTSSHLYSKHAFFIVCGVYLVAIMLAKNIPNRTIQEFYCFYPVFYAGFVTNSFVNNPKLFMERIKSSGWGKCIMLGVTLLAIIIFPNNAPVFDETHNALTTLFYSVLYSLMYTLLYVVIIKNPFKEPLDTTKEETRKMEKEKSNRPFLDMIDRNTFAIYLIHQFILNLLVVLWTEKMHHFAYIVIMPCVFVTVTVVSIVLAESYFRLSRIIKKGKASRLS